MSHITISPVRRDGKFPIRFAYEGGPNAFGGLYPGKVLNKLYPKEQVEDSIRNATTSSTVTNNSYVKFPPVGGDA
tara:strand:+ start:963 stop:1187 length:225 start_codon:yes stop_codon:yes gene_type:complete